MTKEIQITNTKYQNKSVLSFVLCHYFVICALVFVILSVTGCAQETKDKAPVASPEELSGSEQDLEDSSDEMFSSFTVSGYSKGGKKEWDLEGKSADIMSEEIQLTDITSKVYGEQINMTIVADEGSLNRLNNSVHLEKNVLATTDDGATMTTDYLDWDAENEKLMSEDLVQIKRGMMEAQGTGLIAEPALNSIQLKKDVTVKISIEGTGPAADANESVDLDEAGVAATTIITCDGPLDVDYQNNLAVFYENVKVEDNRGEIFADRMDVYFSTEAEEKKQIEGLEGVGIEKITAKGDVKIYHGSNITYSQEALYNAETGKLVLTGRPKLVIYSTEEFGQMMGSK